MPSSLEIAQNAKLVPIEAIAEGLGLAKGDFEPLGKFKAKILARATARKKARAKLVLVTAITPTRAGEGKTTVSIGLCQALNRIGKKAIVCLRQPSLGPVFGMKGGATGGGKSQVLPMVDIDLHFTGDIHAVEAANNLISAAIDNHLHFGNALNINVENIFWKRAMDMNDRALREITVSLGAKTQRKDSFQITAASEIMACLCLSESLQEFKERVARIVVALNAAGKPVTVHDLGVQGAVAILLKDAIKPNLVQTIEGNPAFIHGGPFANIAHGCNSVIATKTAMALSDFVVTEAGFGADLGMEKFFGIKCRSAGLKPGAIVIVATVKALREHGLAEDISLPNLPAVENGFANLEKQVENAKKFGLPVVVAINLFENDSLQELEFVRKKCSELDVKAFVCNFFGGGGKGGTELAKEVAKLAASKNSFRFLYDAALPVKEKILVVAKEMYGAKGVGFSAEAEEKIAWAEKNGFGKLPVCMAKTQFSLSDDPNLKGRPKGFTLKVAGISVSAGAGFIVVFTGKIVTMPGLPRNSAAEKMDIDADGKISGLF
ncbi:MAG: formate--tetrahydrofolate ligase [Candidatus Diapherotrites archaeon]|nr:formate--tetrahydrofolate ligase [Candidatus Diapherotrites archaeon]